MTNSHDHEHDGVVGRDGHGEPPGGRKFWTSVVEQAGQFGVAHEQDGVLTKVEDTAHLDALFEAGSPRLQAYARDRLFVDHAAVNDAGTTLDHGALNDRLGGVAHLDSGDDVGLGSVVMHRVGDGAAQGSGPDALDVLQAIMELDHGHVCGTDNIGPYDPDRPDPGHGHPAWLSTGVRSSSHSHWSGHTDWASHSHWTEVVPETIVDLPLMPHGFDTPPPAGLPGPSEPTIAVIDTGVDFGWEVDIEDRSVLVKPHPWFPDTHVWGTQERSRVLSDWPSGHGTVVTGIIRRCAPELGIWVGAVSFDHKTNLTHESDVIRAIDELPDSCTVLNMSFGGEQFGCNGPLYRRLHQWARNGADTDQRRIVAAAGNREPGDDFGVNSRPAAFNCVYAVAAGDGAEVGLDSSYYSWSNGGDWVDLILRVDHGPVAAGAVADASLDDRRRIFSCTPLDANGEVRYSSNYGTSVVAPLVTAEFALGHTDPVANNGHIRTPNLV